MITNFHIDMKNVPDYKTKFQNVPEMRVPYIYHITSHIRPWPYKRIFKIFSIFCLKKCFQDISPWHLSIIWEGILENIDKKQYNTQSRIL